MSLSDIPTFLLTWVLILPSQIAPTVESIQLFHFPTDNQTLLDAHHFEDYFVPTPGRTWESGRFGCVRSEGTQIHEGIDIRSVHKNANGEPTDEIRATAKGKVAYVSPHSGNSSYGRYVVLTHHFQGLELYSLYAHLSKIRPDLKIGSRVDAKEILGVMGRTANTRSRISKERAHLHFEVGFYLNPDFEEWHKDKYGQKANLHGNFHGYNLAGLNPEHLLLAQARERAGFHFIEWIRSRPIHFRVLIPDPYMTWPRENPALMKRNPRAEKEGLYGFEIAFTFNGTPVQAIPRAPSEWPMGSAGALHLIHVNAESARAHPCRNLVKKQGRNWVLASGGHQLIEIMTYNGNR